MGRVELSAVLGQLREELDKAQKAGEGHQFRFEILVDPYRFRRHHIKWHYGLRGENRNWARRARSTPRNIRTKP
jgi:hypothetical protein